MRRNRLRMLVSSALLQTIPGCDTLQPDEGVFVCQQDTECPGGWVCEARGEPEDSRCWHPLAGDIDAGVPIPTPGPDALNPPGRSGGRSFPTLDAASQYTCGGWKHVRYTDPPPLTAEPFGREWDAMGGPGAHFVCKFEHMINGRLTTLQGKGAFGYGCFAASPPGAMVPAALRASADFDVLVDTKDCARMGEFDPTVRMLATGQDADGWPTFTCRARKESTEVPGEYDELLGRFDPQAKLCWFIANDQPTQQAEQVVVLLAP